MLIASKTRLLIVIFLSLFIANSSYGSEDKQHMIEWKFFRNSEDALTIICPDVCDEEENELTFEQIKKLNAKKNLARIGPAISNPTWVKGLGLMGLIPAIYYFSQNAFPTYREASFWEKSVDSILGSGSEEKKAGRLSGLWNTGKSIFEEGSKVKKVGTLLSHGLFFFYNYYTDSGKRIDRPGSPEEAMTAASTIMTFSFFVENMLHNLFPPRDEDIQIYQDYIKTASQSHLGQKYLSYYIDELLLDRGMGMFAPIWRIKNGESIIVQIPKEQADAISGFIAVYKLQA